MHRKTLLKTARLLAFVSFAGTALAGEAGTAAEAEALVKKAVAAVKAEGPEKAFDELSNSKSFKDLIGMKDPDRKPPVKMLVDVARDKGKGWTETVKFRNPVTDKMQTRVNDIERVCDHAVGSGIYKD